LAADEHVSLGWRCAAVPVAQRERPSSSGALPETPLQIRSLLLRHKAEMQPGQGQGGGGS